MQEDTTQRQEALRRSTEEKIQARGLLLVLSPSHPLLASFPNGKHAVGM